jgi:hypothetical protein
LDSGCSVAPCSAAVDGQAFAFEIKFPADRRPKRVSVKESYTPHKDVCLAAADDMTRQRCVRIIEAASAGGATFLSDIASSVALTHCLLDLSLAAVKAVLAALDVAMDHPSLKAVGFDLPSLKTAGFNAAAFRSTGCDWSSIRAAGFSAAEAKAAGCDLASAQAAGFNVILLVAAYGYDEVAAAGCDFSFFKAFKGREKDLSSFILVSLLLCTWYTHMP